MIDIHLISQCTVEPDVDCLVIPAFEDALNEAAASKLRERRQICTQSTHRER